MPDQINQNKLDRDFKISTLSINNRTTVFLLTFMLILFGFTSYFSLPKEQFPEIVFPQILIGTSYPGNSPADMENLVSRPIENELNSISGIKKITSNNMQDFSMVVAEFNPDILIADAMDKVKDAVDKSKKDLPNDLPSDPDVSEINLSDLPIMFINISGDYSSEELRNYAEYLQDEIEKLPEISKVEIRGLPKKEVEISVDLFKMESLEINFSDIENKIRSENLTASGGNLLTDEYRRSIRVIGEFHSIKDIGNVVVKSEKQNPIFLKDIAKINFKDEERKSYSRLDGQPVATLDVIKRNGENLLDASDKIKILLAKAQDGYLPSDIKITTTNDQSRFTRKMVSNMENSIISGVILVVLVLLFFLGIRNALFVGIAIPLSMLIGFVILAAIGSTINMIVLFSLILALGMLVDNGIVVVENIYRFVQEGLDQKEAAIRGVGEVAWPIIASTATTIAAFLPLIFWNSIMGEFMKFLPITLIIVLSSSLFVALVINPVIASRFVKIEEIRTKLKTKRLFRSIGIIFAIALLGHFGNLLWLRNLGIIIILLLLIDAYLIRRTARWFQDKFLPWLEHSYHRTIAFALAKRRPYLFISGIFALLLLSVFITVVRSPKVDLFPSNDPRYINIYIELPIGTDIDKTNHYVKGIEAIVDTVLEPNQFLVESMTAQVGEGTNDPSRGPSGGSTPNRARITVTFLDYEFRQGVSTKQVMENIRDALTDIPGSVITVEKNANGPDFGKPVNIEISGDNLDTLVNQAYRIKQVINQSGILGIEELLTDVEQNKPELLIRVNRKAAGRFGVSTSRVANEIRTALFGKEISKYKVGEDKYPIMLRLADKYRYNRGSLFDQKITFRDQASGKISQVPISTVASDSSTFTYNSIKRKGLKRVVTVYSNVKEGYNATEIIDQLKVLFSDYKLPAGYELKFTGQQEEQNASTAFLGKALMIAVFLIFLIIVTQFNSMAAPFMIMLTVLFSLIGVLFGLAIFKMDFIIIMTGIGIISLAGVVVNNAIVLIDYINLLRERKRHELGVNVLNDEDVKKAIIQGGSTRLRPVLLTAITTVLGLIPLAVGLNFDYASLVNELNPHIYWGGDSAGFWAPMAWTVIFGLSFATFLTLVIVPVMYLIIERIKRRFYHINTKKKNINV